MWNRLPPASQLFTTAWLTLIYLLVSVLTLQLGFATEYALPLWPAAGVGVGMLLLYHRVALLPILLGALLTDIYLEASLGSLISAVPNALAATLQAYIGYRFTRTLLRRSSALVRDQDILRFLLLSGPLACLTAPGIGIIMRLWNGQLLPEDAFSEWLTWWSGDTLGVLLFAPLTLLLLGRRQAHEASRRIGAYRIALPLLGASLLLGGGHLLLSHLQIQEAEYSIQGRMEKVNQLHFQSIAADLQHLEASSQMILSQEELTAAEFERFSQWLLHNPALISLDWAPRITAVERPAFEQQTGQELVEPLGEAKQDVVYVSAHGRNEHFPILFSVPPAMGQTVKGLDHSWDPGRREAMARAFATRTVQLSRPATLIRTGLNAVLAFAPVIPPEVEGQPAAPLGMVVGVFEIERLFSPLLQQAENAGLAVRVTDITEPEQPLVLIDRVAQQDSIFRTDRLDLGGRQWQLDFVLLTPLHSAGSSGTERFYFLFAILAALLAAYTTLSLAERDLATRLTVMRRTPRPQTGTQPPTRGRAGV